MSVFLKTVILACIEFRLFAKEVPCFCIRCASKMKASAINVHDMCIRNALKVPYWCHRSTSMPERQMVSLCLGSLSEFLCVI